MDYLKIVLFRVFKENFYISFSVGYICAHFAKSAKRKRMIDFSYIKKLFIDQILTIHSEIFILILVLSYYM